MPAESLQFGPSPAAPARPARLLARPQIPGYPSPSSTPPAFLRSASQLRNGSFSAPACSSSRSSCSWLSASSPPSAPGALPGCRSRFSGFILGAWCAAMQPRPAPAAAPRLPLRRSSAHRRRNRLRCRPPSFRDCSRSRGHRSRGTALATHRPAPHPRSSPSPTRPISRSPSPAPCVSTFVSTRRVLARSRPSTLPMRRPSPPPCAPATTRDLP